MLPEHHKIREHHRLRIFGDILQDPHIFHLTRRSAAGGVATGLFFAFLPVPGQMIVAALSAILLRVNLPLAVVFVWVTNPVTIPPLFFLAYKTGAILLARHPQPVEFAFTLEWLGSTFLEIWPSVAVGCLILGSATAAIGYLSIRLLWRIATMRKWAIRRATKNRV